MTKLLVEIWRNFKAAENLLYGSLMDMLDSKDPLNCFSRYAIKWSKFEDEFKILLTKREDQKPIRLMVGLLILKQLENLSDENVVAWKEKSFNKFLWI